MGKCYLLFLRQVFVLLNMPFGLYMNRPVCTGARVARVPKGVTGGVALKVDVRHTCWILRQWRPFPEIATGYITIRSVMYKCRFNE